MRWKQAIFCLTLVAATNSAVAATRPKVGAMVPDFSVKTAKGETITRQSSKGKTLVLVFIRPNQEYSLDALRVAGKISARNNGSLKVVGISTKPDKGDFFGKFEKKAHIDIPIAVDEGNKAYTAFGVIVSPTTFVIDAKGVLRYRMPHLFSGYAEKLSAHVQFVLGKIDADEHEKLLAERRLSLTEKQLEEKRQLALAKAFIDAHKPADALPILKQLKGSKNTTVMALYGGACLDLKKIKEADAVLGAYVKEQSLPSDLQLTMARYAISKGDAASAEKRLEGVTDHPADLAKALTELGRLYERKRQNDKALACYRRALQQLYPEVKELK